MSPAVQGALVLVATIAVFMTGAPVAFALGAVAIAFLVLFQGVDSLQVAAETLYSGLHDFTLVSIPMFVMMGAAIGSSPAGRDLYIALDRWLYRVPGGLVISNLGACALFAALTGSSPATCAAIGKMGIPEMRRRGYPDAVATGSICAGGTLGILIPPSITFILYGIATETSIGRLFLAGVVPGLLLTGLFMAWTLLYIWRSGFRAYAADFRYSWAEKFASIPKVAPFLVIVIGVMYVLYGGVATPSEAAGVGAALCFLLAVLIYRMWNPKAWWAILRSTTRESVMILMIIATAVLFSYMLTSLYITQTLAEAIAAAEVNRWVLMGLINVFLLVCGCFIPPAGIILMTAPILLPIITAAGFDPVWFGVIVTINMEIGLITPPVGLNLFVVNAISPDVPTKTVLWGSVPYVLCMVLAIVILSIFPELATWLPDYLMGPAGAAAAG
jgi:tripartite ATP-independent transporter DctM subunit